MNYIFTFSNLSDVLKDNERSGKHVQHLKVFLFFNLVYCSIHFTVTLQPFLNTPFLSNKPPRPPFCPSFLVMPYRYHKFLCIKNIFLVWTQRQHLISYAKHSFIVTFRMAFTSHRTSIPGVKIQILLSCPHTFVVAVLGRTC